MTATATCGNTPHPMTTTEQPGLGDGSQLSEDLAAIERTGGSCGKADLDADTAAVSYTHFLRADFHHREICKHGEYTGRDVLSLPLPRILDIAPMSASILARPDLLLKSVLTPLSSACVASSSVRASVLGPLNGSAA